MHITILTHSLEALGSCTIEMDIFRVEQVVRNFLSNAIKFSSKGKPITLQLSLLSEEDFNQSHASIIRENREQKKESLGLGEGVGISQRLGLASICTALGRIMAWFGFYHPPLIAVNSLPTLDIETGYRSESVRSSNASSVSSSFRSVSSSFRFSRMNSRIYRPSSRYLLSYVVVN